MPIRKPKPKVVTTPAKVLTPPVVAPPIAAEPKPPAERFRMIHTRLTMRQWRQVADLARDDDTSVQSLVVDALRAHLEKRGITLE